MKATRLPSGNYRVNLYLGKDQTGKQIRKSITAPTKTQCIKDALEYLEKHKNECVASDTVISAINEYISLNENTFSITTTKNYLGIVRDLQTHYPDFCNKKLSEVTSEDIQVLIDDLHKNRKRSTKTIHNKMGLVSPVFKSKGLKMPKYSMPQKQKVVYNIPSSRHVKRMLKCAKEQNSELWVCIMLAATGPLREGEIAALSIKDINFKKNQIHVCHSMAINKNNEWEIKAPKTYGSDRFLVMPAELIKTIKEQGYVTHWKPRQIYEQFKRLLKANRIKDCRFHDLRHYCVSELKAQGFPDVYIAQRTGHTNLSTLRNVYTHVLDNHQTKVDKEIIKHFNKTFLE